MENGKEKFDQLINRLNERNKELNCLYSIDEILNDTEQSLKDVFRQLIEIIPSAFQYPDICAVRIKWQEQEVSSRNFKPTALKLQKALTVEDQKNGEITVVYIKPVKSEKGIFIPEEYKLLSTIAEKLENFILYKQVRISLEKLEARKVKPNTTETAKNLQLRNWLKDFGLNPDETDKLLQFSVRFKKGETICKQGAITSYVMLLAEGLTKNYLEGTQEKGFNLKIITPFDFIGLTSIFGNNKYLFSGAALTPSTLYMIEKSLFQELILSNQEFTHMIMQWFSKTTEYHLNRLSCIANKQSLGRIAEILIYLVEDVFSDTFIPASISRKDIAELAGMSTESAVRMLSELKKDKIITVSSPGILVNDIQLLKTLSRAG
ncbi:MAG: Crp/Fnr family transcriptional regulator [Bacteroidales bacterium]